MDASITRILKNTNIVQNKTNNNQQFLPDCYLFPEEIIHKFSGPALLTNLQMQVLSQNIQAESFVQSLSEKKTVLLNMVKRCVATKNPENQKIILENINGTRHFDLLALPASPSNNDGKARVLLIGKDITIEQNLTKALVDSRRMFKDLVECSSDFSWETDNLGCFKYISPRGILGYTAYELNGKNAADLIIDSGGSNPFDTLDKVHNMEIWLQRSDGSKACILVSAVPIIDNSSTWQGARGTCSDITEKKEHEATLRRIKTKEQVLNRIISSFRDTVEPKDMLKSAVNSTLEGIPSAHCGILQMNEKEDGTTVADLKYNIGCKVDKKIFYELCHKAVKIWQDPHRTQPISTIYEKIGEYEFLMGITQHHGKINGTLFLLRNKTDPAWSDNDLSLFRGIICQLGLAMEFLKSQEILKKISLTDELTGLLNRRAFHLDINKRLRHQKRSKKDCALLYIDIDNFKAVNDTHGHARGDKILAKLSKILKDNIRIGDYASRLGGDEFAIWLNNITEEGAEKKAKAILDAVPMLQKIACKIKPTLSLSIGIAMSKPEEKFTIHDILEKADRALYHVKNSGKNNYSFAIRDDKNA